MPAPVDLIYLAPGLGTGGTERHLAWLLPALQKRGLRLEVWNTGEEGDAAQRLRQSGVTVLNRRAPVSPRQVGRLAALTAALARRRPRLVHSYLYAHHWLDALACRLAGTTYVGSRRNLAHWRQGPVLARERWRDRVSALSPTACRCRRGRSMPGPTMKTGWRAAGMRAMLSVFLTTPVWSARS
jgi:hypothetical protein